MKKYFYLLTFILVCGGQIIYGQSKSGLSGKMVKPLNRQTNYDCLPAEINLDTVVSVIRQTTDLRGKVKRETVKQRLVKLNAGCKAGKLIDGKNREIRFYQLQGCWGNPPPEYQEILSRQQTELRELKNKFTVIEITCNSSGEMPY